MLDPGQGKTRWALKQTLASLERYLPAAVGERRARMERERDEIQEALKAGEANP